MQHSTTSIMEPPPGISVSRGNLNLTKKYDLKQEMIRAAWTSGVSGGLSGVVQVLSMMWLRTVMNTQYANGGTFSYTIRMLYREGGIRRLYRGVLFAIIQNPVTRFGDTAINSGGIVLLDSVFPNLQLFQKILVTTFVASLWRMFLTPIDLIKTNFQVHGKSAYVVLYERVQSSGVFSVWSGAFAIIIANWFGSYPWFITYNVLQSTFPRVDARPSSEVIRNALIGFCSSVASDVSSNGIRVIKTQVQTNFELNYRSACFRLYNEGGVREFFRGLRTRLLVNALQSTLFTVVWKMIETELRKASVKYDVS